MRRSYIFSIFTILAVGMLLVPLIGSRFFRPATAKTVTPALQRGQLGQPASVRGATRGKPWINLGDGHDLLTAYTAAERSTVPEPATPLALATADFDEDGIADLVSCFGGPNSIRLHRGNPDSIYPNSPAARQRKAAGQFSDVPFVTPAAIFEVPEAPDFIGTGDFNGDGHQDLVVAATGSAQLFWMVGDGKGGFGQPKKVELPGNVTAMATGEINRADSLADVILAVAHDDRGELLVFEGPRGAFNQEPERIPIDAPASSLALGQLDDEYSGDLAVAAGSQLLIVHGRDRKLSVAPALRAEQKSIAIDRIACGFEIASIATGKFTGERDDSLAVLASNGQVHLFSRDKTNAPPVWGRESGQVTVITSGQVSSESVGPNGAKLVRARLSTRPNDDLVVIDRRQNQLHLVIGETLASPTPVGSSLPQIPITMEMDGPPSTVLPMRLNVDALSDLVILKSGGESAIAIALTEAGQTFTVNTEEGGQDYKLGDGVCADSDGKCSFQAALQENDAGGGSATIKFSVNRASIHFIWETYKVLKPVTIDGTSIGHVVLDGGGGQLEIAGGNSVVRGLSVFNTLRVRDNTNNRVEDCYIKTLVIWADNTIVGGTVESARNYLLVLGAAGVRDVVFKGNTVGQLAPNTQPQPGGGVQVYASTNTVIGGLQQGESNSIFAGIYISGYSNPTYMTTGTQVVYNGFYAINCGEKTSGTSITNNSIQYNYGPGVVINADSTNGLIRENQITDNTGWGISNEGTDYQILGNLVYGNGFGGGANGGIMIGQGAARTIIQANWIGIYSSGNFAAPNYGPGIEIHSSGNTIGGDRNSEGNLISGNSGSGILIGSDANQNQVKGNWIGVQSDGVSALANTGDGIANNGELNPIGATAANLRNLIAFNGGDGVSISAGDKGNSVLGNEIFSNFGKGINIRSGQVSPVPDIVLNFRGGRTVIDGKLKATASTTYRVEFFTNTECDTSGSGEGKALLGALNVTTGANGEAEFSPELYPSQNQIVTATVTDPAGNTSEFSKCNELDEIKLVDLVPPQTEVLAPDTKVDFTVTASYLLKSRFRADVTVKLEDANKGTVAFASEEIKSTDGPGQKTIHLNGVTIPSFGDKLVVRLFLTEVDAPNEGPIFKEAPQVEFRITSKDLIEMQNPLFDNEPAATAKIYAGTTVEYKCDIKYHIPSDPKGGVVAMQAFDMTSGTPKAISNINLVPVDRTTDPKVLTAEIVTLNIPLDASLMQIRAVLLDSSGVKIVTKQFVDYAPFQIKIELGETVSTGDPFVAFDPPLILLGGASENEQRADRFAIKVRSNLGPEFNQAFPYVYLYKQRATEDPVLVGAVFLVQPFELPPNPAYRFRLDGVRSKIPDDYDSLLLQLKYVFPLTGKTVSSKYLTIPIARVRITANPANPNFPGLSSTLVAGRTEKFGYKLEHNAAFQGVNKLQARVAFGLLTPVLVDLPLQASGTRYEFDVPIPFDARYTTLQFILSDSTGSEKAFSETRYIPGLDKSKITIPPGIGQVLNNTLGVDIKNIQNQIDRNIDTVRRFGNMLTAVLHNPSIATLRASPAVTLEAAPNSASSLRNYVLVNTYWIFDPPIAADGSFVADLTLAYSSSDLPDHPGFNESSLKMLSYDPVTGAVEALPTTVDTTAHKATARVNRLAPYYALGVQNLFSGEVVAFPILKEMTDFSSKLYLLNNGTVNSSLTISSYDDTGEMYAGNGMVNPATIPLMASQLRCPTTADILNPPSSGLGAGWFRVASNQKALMGYELVGNGDRLDGIMIPAVYPNLFVITAIEKSATWTTELNLANVSPFICNVHLELHNAAGNTVGAWDGSLPGRSKFAADIQDIFPGIAGTFSGYVMGWSGQELAAVALLTSTHEMAAIGSQRLEEGESLQVRLYAPYVVSQATLGTRVSLVNPTAKPAAIKFQLLGTSGEKLATDVELPLGAGQLYEKSINELFGMAPASQFTGTLIVDANAEGVVGHVSYSDPGGTSFQRAILPLKAETGNSFLFPLVGTAADTYTRVAITSAWHLPATVDLQVFGNDGVLRSSVMLPLQPGYSINARLNDLVPGMTAITEGYFRIHSTQPIAADALYGKASGTMLTALPAMREDGTIAANVVAVSSANYAGTDLASESIVSAYGPYLATAQGVPSSQPLPTALGGTTVQFEDSAGTIRLAPLFFVSPGQVNFQIPPGTALGPAKMTVTNGNGFVTTGTIMIVSVKPGIFSVTQDGNGLAAANTIYIKQDGSRQYVSTAQWDPMQSKYVATPIDLSREGEVVYLEIYGTGIRFNTGLAGVSCKIGGTGIAAEYAGPQWWYVGLDQINLRVPASLKGRGEVPVEIIVDGRVANTVLVNMK